MASDTAPAAVSAPGEPPADHPTQDAGHTPQGGLAGLLAPIQPARSAAFSLPDINSADPAAVQAAATASSADYAHTDTPQNSTDGNSTRNASQERGIVRAWLLAGAERWRKGGDARLKRLDIEKARAQAYKEARQIKENRTVNRAERMVGGSTNSATGSKTAADKSTSSKSSNSGPSAGKQNTSSGSSGRTGGGSGGKGGSSGAGRSGPSGSSGSKNAAGGQAPGGSHGRSGSGSGGKSGSGSTNTFGGRGTPAGGPGGTGTGTKQPSGTAGGTAHGTAGKQGPAGTPGKPGKDAPAPTPGKHKTVKLGKDTAAKTGDDTSPDRKTGDKQRTDKAATPGPDKTSLEKEPKPATDGQPSKTAGADSNSRNPKGDKTTSTSTTTDPAPAAPRIDTQASRETGYRDGSRAARAAAHIEAYRDGVKDGWNDTREAAAHDKHRLDQAHADRKADRAKDKPVPQTASSADYEPTIPPKPDHAPGPQPIHVTGTDATHIHLGAGADRPTVTRGEVRTLRRFQQVFEDKTTRMTKVAEATRALEHHANEQAKKVTQLLEQARGMEGGDKLLTALSRLAEAAQTQITAAAEVHKRGIRSSEACKTLHANTDTRYGGIYQAVVDSPETQPAELAYYREMTHA